MPTVSSPRSYVAVELSAGSPRQFNDRSYVFTGVPASLVGATLFQGPCHHQAGDRIRILGARGRTFTVYVLISNGNAVGEKTKIQGLLSGWATESFATMKTTSFTGATGFQAYKKVLNAFPAEIEFTLNTHIELSIVAKACSASL